MCISPVGSGTDPSPRSLRMIDWWVYVYNLFNPPCSPCAGLKRLSERPLRVATIGHSWTGEVGRRQTTVAVLDRLDPVAMRVDWSEEPAGVNFLCTNVYR